MGKKRASFQPGFEVKPTVGKAAEGDDSLSALNEIIQAIPYPDATSEQMGNLFTAMKRICAACALYKGITKPGGSKIRQGGSPDDFLDFAVLHYVDRWRKQFLPADKRRPVVKVLNWIPLITSTIHFHLINYNKDIFDYDFLPLPNYYGEDQEGSFDKDLPESKLDSSQLTYVELEMLQNPVVLRNVLFQLPDELRPHIIDILHYLASPGTLISKERRNFVIIGKAFLRKGLEKSLRE